MIEKTIDIEDEASTQKLARLLAELLPHCRSCRNILLLGDLGAGKTFLVKALVEALPGADQADIGSPSFNIMNLYPTTPQAAHFDLYRLETGGPGEELDEFFCDDETLVLVEWADRLHAAHLPESYLHIRMQTAGPGKQPAELQKSMEKRKVSLSFYGPDAAIDAERFTQAAENAELPPGRA
jgi:tRNA threonylcarbamoyladenosine biosynthesis protein TsaE